MSTATFPNQFPGGGVLALSSASGGLEFSLRGGVSSATGASPDSGGFASRLLVAAIAASLRSGCSADWWVALARVGGAHVSFCHRGWWLGQPLTVAEALWGPCTRGGVEGPRVLRLAPEGRVEGSTRVGALGKVASGSLEPLPDAVSRGQERLRVWFRRCGEAPGGAQEPEPWASGPRPGPPSVAGPDAASPSAPCRS